MVAMFKQQVVQLGNVDLAAIERHGGRRASAVHPHVAYAVLAAEGTFDRLDALITGHALNGDACGVKEILLRPCSNICLIHNNSLHEVRMRTAPCNPGLRTELPDTESMSNCLHGDEGDQHGSVGEMLWQTSGDSPSHAADDRASRPQWASSTGRQQPRIERGAAEPE